MQDPFRHEALPYAGRAQFVAACVEVVRDGLEQDERLILLAAGEKIDEVRHELGGDADDVTFVAIDEHGRNPSRITTMLHSFQAAGDGRHSIGVNESVFTGRSPAAHLEAQFSEVVLNDPSLRTWPLSVVCLYDTEQLDQPALHAMQQSHAVIRGQPTNASYVPDLAAAMHSAMLDPPPVTATRLVVHPTGLTEMRAFVRSAAAEVRLPADRAEDLVLAVNEIVTNSLRHGGGRAMLALWFEPGSIICEVADSGHITDPLVGRLAPPPGATSGRGLWLANHLCDLVQLRSSAAGTVVRMYLDR
jgi:anti-sigma regulatory factor (Ser/Thr protein kinase)